jgi:hypothetical protein
MWISQRPRGRRVKLNGELNVVDRKTGIIKIAGNLNSKVATTAAMSYPFLISRCASPTPSTPWTRCADFQDINLTQLRRTLDPIFAVSVGITAAVVRINREEKEKGKSFEESKSSLERRAALAWTAWKEVMGVEEKVGKGSGWA